MKNIFNFKNIAYERQVFGLLLLLVTFPVLLLGMLSSMLFFRSEKQQMDLLTHTYYNSIYADYESAFTEIKQYYSNFIQTDDYRWLRSQQTIPYSEYSHLSESQRMLEGNLFLKPLIARYSYINVESEWMLSPYGMTRTEQLVNHQDYERFLKDQAAISSDSYWVFSPIINMDIGYDRKKEDFLELDGVNLVIKQGKSGLDRPRNMILVRLSETALMDMLTQVLPAGYEGAILDRNGETVLETPGGISAAAVLMGPGAEGEKFTWQSWLGDTYYIEQGSLSPNGFTYLVGYNQKSSLNRARDFLAISFAVACFMALLLMAIRLIAVHLSRPVKDLSRQLKQEQEQRQTSFLMSLLKGIESKEYPDEAILSLNLPEAACYRVMLLTARLNEEGEKKDINQVLRRLLEEIPQDINYKLLLPSIVYHKKIILLIYGDNEAEVDIKTAEIYYTLKDVLRDSLDGSLSFGASRFFYRIEYARRAYGEASQALEQKRSGSEENLSIAIYHQEAPNETPGHAYEMIVEKEILQMMKDGSPEQVKMYLELYLENLESRCLPLMARQFYISRLLVAMIQLLLDAKISLDTCFREEKDAILERAVTFYNRHELFDYIYEKLALPITLQMQKFKGHSTTSEIVKKTLRLIKDSDGDITLLECADQLGYHPTYITKLLKAEMETNFTELCNREKLNRAKAMLMTTDYSVAEIAGLLGYSNAQNFIRFFSKYEKLTPAKYKSEHKGHSLK